MATTKELISNLIVETSPLNEADIDQLDPILRAHVRDSKSGELLAGEVEEIKGYMRGTQDEYGRVRTYMVARDHTGGVLGCMAYSTPDPDMVEHFSLGDPDDSIELLNAFVSPAVFRGGGVGRKLFASIVGEGKRRGKKQLLINSGPRYEKSWGFYDKMASEAGFVQNKYGGGRHAKAWVVSLV